MAGATGNAADDGETRATATPRGAASPGAAAAEADEKLGVLETLAAGIAPKLRPGLAVARDNPGRTPQQWSVTGEGDRPVLSFGLIDRTFFWTWDGGDSNHYAKDAALATGVILGELRRFGHIG